MLIGVNLSGAEFGDLGGEYGRSYIYPSASDLAYYAERGVELVRLPVRWERLQPALGEELDAAELGRLQKFLGQAGDLGVQVIVDVHNYGGYGGQKIGGSSVSEADFADFWSKLASAIKSAPALAGYDLMNEPVGFASASVWPSAAQAAVDAIRRVDMSHDIYVEGEGWASAANWSRNNPSLPIHDPADRIVYEAHVYFDQWSSGTYKGSYDEEKADPQVGARRIQDFVQWLDKHDARGFIGEFAVPDNDPRWLEVLDNFLTAMRAAGLDGTYWGAGPWWGSYPMALRNPDGSESAQLDVLERHIAAERAAVPTMTGTAAADVLGPGAGDVRLAGGEGDDSYVVDGRGDQVIERPDGGHDRVEALVDGYALSDWVEDLSLSGRAVSGTGNALGNVIRGGDLGDTLTGLGGADELYGGGGADLLDGGTGDDRLSGGTGADRLSGGEGFDTADYSGSSAGVIVLLDRVDRWGISGQLQGAEAGGRAGDALGDSLESIEAVIGSRFGDRIYGAAVGTTAYLGGGTDTFDNSGLTDAVDRIYGESGDDWIWTGAGDDFLSGSVGHDRLYGEHGNDRIEGGAGDDRLWGGPGGDRLDGGDGDDTLFGEGGSDLLLGGPGRDVFAFRSTADSAVATPDSVLDFGVGDLLDLKAIDANGSASGEGSFILIGTRSFSHQRAELRFETRLSEDGGPALLLQGDVTGDAVADFAILLYAEKGDLTSGSFIL